MFINSIDKEKFIIIIHYYTKFIDIYLLNKLFIVMTILYYNTNTILEYIVIINALQHVNNFTF